MCVIEDYPCSLFFAFELSSELFCGTARTSLVEFVISCRATGLGQQRAHQIVSCSASLSPFLGTNKSIKSKIGLSIVK